MDSRELKIIAERFSLDQIERCIRQQVEKGENSCNVTEETDTVVQELSKATVIREMMNQGMSFSQALRELGKRIRAVYSSKDGR